MKSIGLELFSPCTALEDEYASLTSKKPLAGPLPVAVAFAPTESPDAVFVVYRCDARRDVACEPLSPADARLLNKTTPT